MAMKRCPICGEKYSDTYKSCPFCEEEEALQSGAQIRRTAPGRGGKRTAARGRQPNLLSPILIVLIVIMAALLVYLLFGDRIAQRLSGGEETQDTSTEDVTPQPPDPDTADPEGGDGVTMPESGGTGEMEDPNDGGTTTPAQTDPSTLPETLTIAYLGSPRTEFTMSVGDEPIPLTVSGGSGTYTWSSSDDGIASGCTRFEIDITVAAVNGSAVDHIRILGRISRIRGVGYLPDELRMILNEDFSLRETAFDSCIFRCTYFIVGVDAVSANRGLEFVRAAGFYDITISRAGRGQIAYRRPAAPFDCHFFQCSGCQTHRFCGAL